MINTCSSFWKWENLKLIQIRLLWMKMIEWPLLQFHEDCKCTTATSRCLHPNDCLVESSRFVGCRTYPYHNTLDGYRWFGFAYRHETSKQWCGALKHPDAVQIPSRLGALFAWGDFENDSLEKGEKGWEKRRFHRHHKYLTKTSGWGFQTFMDCGFQAGTHSPGKHWYLHKRTHMCILWFSTVQKGLVEMTI